MGRRLEKPRWIAAQVTTVVWLARGTFFLVAAATVVAGTAVIEARPGLMPPVQIEPLPFFGTHTCIYPSDVEEPPAPPPEEEPPCSRKGKRSGAR
ncbi:hypothetical protein [Polyangium sorediatum]|uniref:Uncharacterized protein n=1 Tax=Polyangium sorediatum TaxID=889274 RepID=A0ABT6P9I5_9BACT|nr:hypothetical protein [Polyangium sorediatum]MDI1437193.1 hypothetical protein [Polyangium sorediatum]